MGAVGVGSGLGLGLGLECCFDCEIWGSKDPGIELGLTVFVTSRLGLGLGLEHIPHADT